MGHGLKTEKSTAVATQFLAGAGHSKLMNWLLSTVKPGHSIHTLSSVRTRIQSVCHASTSSWITVNRGISLPGSGKPIQDCRPNSCNFHGKGEKKHTLTVHVQHCTGKHLLQYNRGFNLWVSQNLAEWVTTVLVNFQASRSRDALGHKSNISQGPINC